PSIRRFRPAISSAGWPPWTSSPQLAPGASGSPPTSTTRTRRSIAAWAGWACESVNPEPAALPDVAFAGPDRRSRALQAAGHIAGVVGPAGSLNPVEKTLLKIAHGLPVQRQLFASILPHDDVLLLWTVLLAGFSEPRGPRPHIR